MLSGFVLAHSYGRRLGQGTGFLEFMGKRVIRLYPMFMVGIIVGAPVLYAAVQFGHASYSSRDVVVSTLCSLFFLPYLNDGTVFRSSGYGSTLGPLFPSNDPVWSLFFELVASAFFVLLCRFPRKVLIWIMLTCYLLIVMRGVIFGYLEHTSAIMNAGWGTSNFLGGLPRVFYGFTLGVILYSMVGNEKIKRVGTRVQATKYSAVFLYASLLAILHTPTFRVFITRLSYLV